MSTCFRREMLKFAHFLCECFAHSPFPMENELDEGGEPGEVPGVGKPAMEGTARDRMINDRAAVRRNGILVLAATGGLQHRIFRPLPILL